MVEGPFFDVDRPAAQPLILISASFESFIVSNEDIDKLKQQEERTAFVDFLNDLIPDIGDEKTEFEVRDIEVDNEGKAIEILTERKTVTSEMLLDIESWLETEIGTVSSVTVEAK